MSLVFLNTPNQKVIEQLNMQSSKPERPLKRRMDVLVSALNGLNILLQIVIKAESLFKTLSK